MDGLVDAVALALAVGDAAQAGTGEQTDAAGDNTGLVGDDVAEQVARDDDAVQGAGVLDEDHGGGVDELVLDLELGELPLEQLGDDLAPQAAGGQDVGLVQAPDGLLAAGDGEEAGQAADALDLLAGVGLRVPGLAVAGVLLALAKVDTARQLADDDHVGAAADVGLEGGEVDEGLGGEAAGAQVTVGSHLLAEPQETLLGADGAGAPFRAADGAEEDGVGGVGGGEGLVGEGGAGGVDGGLAGGWLECRCGIEQRAGPEETYTTQEVVLEVELAGGGAAGLNCLEDLRELVSLAMRDASVRL